MPRARLLLVRRGRDFRRVLETTGVRLRPDGLLRHWDTVYPTDYEPLGRITLKSHYGFACDCESISIGTRLVYGPSTMLTSLLGT